MRRIITQVRTSAYEIDQLNCLVGLWDRNSMDPDNAVNWLYESCVNAGPVS
jgi:hypothetical protein